MRKKLLSLISVILSVLMMSGVSGLSLYAGAEDGSSFENGDIIEFGSYPQSRLDDEADAALISELESMAPDISRWDTYVYGNNNTYMHYSDVVYGPDKYRVINIDAFNYNGYDINTHYWFKFEPLKWRVLDAQRGIILSESIIDSKALQDTAYYDSKSNIHYTDSNKEYYANNYSQSTLRRWLNEDFYNIAFTSDEQALLAVYACDNSAYSTDGSNYNSKPLITKDKVFILSYSEVKKTDWGFSESTDESESRVAYGTDYAMSQPLDTRFSGGKSPWWLRSPAPGGSFGTMSSCIVEPNGIICGSYWYAYNYNPMSQYEYKDGDESVTNIECGVRPALQLIRTPSGAYTKCNYFIEYGNYPQSRVIKSDLISELTALVPEDTRLWDSYGYYSGTGEFFDGLMEAKDYMRYKDVVFEGKKYRAVVFDTYRPADTGIESTETVYSHQSENGYSINTVYWFIFEPIKWWVLDPESGLAMCETAIDSQAYNNFMLWFDINGDGVWDEDDIIYGDKAQTHYANDYENSSIRKWLNDDFFNTAFTGEEQSNIKPTALSGSSLSDRVFLLTYDDVNSRDYGFNTGSELFNKYSHFKKSSDYAKCQGCNRYKESRASVYYGNCSWWLRSSGDDTQGNRGYEEYGRFAHFDVDSTWLGIVPAIRLAEIKSDTALSPAVNPDRYSVSFDANGHGDIPDMQIVEEGQAPARPAPDPAEKGFIFGGWFKEAECENEWDFDKEIPASSVTLYAKWTECDHSGSSAQPTCTEDAVCSLCEAHLPSTGHIIGKPVAENTVEASCTKEGSYDKVVYCTVCGDVLSRNKVTVNASGHIYGEEVIENEIDASCTDDGGYDIAVYCTVCGEELSRTAVSVPSAGHNAGDPVIENIKNASCIKEGSYDKVIYCTDCGAELQRTPASIPFTGHAVGEPVIENAKKPSCTQEGSYDIAVYCTVCGIELSRSTQTVPAAGHTDKNNDGICEICGETDESINDAYNLENLKKAEIKTGNDTKVGYNTPVTVVARADLPEGYRLAVYDGDTQLAAGTNKEVTADLGRITQERAVTVKILGKDGRPVEGSAEKTVRVTADTDFFARLTALIKTLLGLMKTVVIKP